MDLLDGRDVPELIKEINSLSDTKKVLTYFTTEKKTDVDEIPDIPQNIFTSNPQPTGTATIRPFISTLGKSLLGVDFHAEKSRCVAKGILFEDIDFPADDSSLYFDPPHEKENIIWKRPKDIVGSPQFLDDAQHLPDIVQGSIRDSWLSATLSLLAIKEEIFERIVPDNQKLDTEYAGIFHFHIWRFGEWLDVVIDDRLPTVNGNLCFTRSRSPLVFWAALLQKAYAKIFGCYQNLAGGTVGEVLEDLSGGLVEEEMIKLSDPAPVLARIIGAFYTNALIACHVDADGIMPESTDANGITSSVLYSLTGVYVVDGTDDKESVVLLRIHDATAKTVYKGAWSSESPERTSLSEENKTNLETKKGEFWVSLDDFVKYFKHLIVCNFTATALEEMARSCESKKSTPKIGWDECEADGDWNISNNTANGSERHFANFHRNPQFLVKVRHRNELINCGECVLIIALMQKNRREQRCNGVENLDIGFNVYETKDSLAGPLDRGFFMTHLPFIKARYFIKREVTTRFRFPPGNYVIVPSTFQARQEGEFLLRIFSDSNVEISALSD